jgi:hypothetical protein
MSSFSLAERKKRLGALDAESEERIEIIRENRPKEIFPSELDWRNVNGVSYVTPVLDQGRCGSCVSFAMLGALETQLNILRGVTTSPWKHSAQHLVACGYSSMGCNGWHLRHAVQFLEWDGVPDEACFPYVSGATGVATSCSETCADAKSRTTRISSSSGSDSLATIDDLKSALRLGPVVATLLVFEDFSFYKDGVYKYTSGGLLGAHAIVLVGWSDAEQAWIGRNSWGTQWGQKGFFKIAWDNGARLGYTWRSLAVDGKEYVALEGMRDREVVRGVVPLEFLSTYPGTSKLEFSVRQGGVEKLRASATDRKAVWDTTTIPDGRYEVQPVAFHAGGLASGQPRGISVLNGPFAGSVRILSPQNGLAYAGKVKVEIELSASPVPFTSLVFRKKNLATGSIQETTTENLATNMVLNWNTGSLAAGDYELSVEGRVGNLASIQSDPVKVLVVSP